MIFQLQISDLPLLLDLKRQQQAGLGRAHPPSKWRSHSLAHYEQLYRENLCMHVAWRDEGRVAAIAGVIFIEDAPFLSNRVKSYALLVDECVLPEFRGLGIEGQLRDALLAIVAKREAILCATLPPNFTRLTALSAGNLRV